MTEQPPEDQQPEANLESLTPEERTKFEKVLASYIRTEAYHYDAPIPPPAQMEHFNQIVPGSGKQMTDDAHHQSTHRRDMESKEVDTNTTLARRGQIFGFIIAMSGFIVVMTAVVGGLILAYLERGLGPSFGFAFFGLAAIAAVFVANWWRGQSARHTQSQSAEPVRQDEN